MTRIAAAALALTIAFATPVLAQGQGKGHQGKGNEKHDKGAVVQGAKTSGRERAQVTHGKSAAHDKNVRVTEVRRDSRGRVITTSSAKSKGGAPSFCRSGAGHPVYGRSWCVEKGFGLGSSRWDRATWGSNVVFGTRRTSTIRDVLGSIILGRVTNYAAQRLGLTSPLTGTWLVNNQDRSVYLVRSGSTPVAEFVDTNYDGRADYVLLHNR